MSAQSEKIRRELEQAFAGVKTETAARLLEKLQERTPVRTGYTRSRWTAKDSGQHVDVDNDARDAIARLNDGSSRRVPAGFIEQAIDETIAEMQREVSKP